MKKLRQYVMPVVLVTGSAIFLSGCLPTGQKTQTPKDVLKEGQELAKAIETGKPIHCQISNEDKSEEMEYWVKGEKIKMVGSNLGSGMEDQTGYVITDGEYMYVWSDGEENGMKMKMPSDEEMAEAEDAAKTFMEEMPDFGDEEVMAEFEDEGYMIDCKQQNISDSEFVPPSDIVFQDLEAMMNEAFSGMEGELENLDVDSMELDPAVEAEMDKLMQEMGNTGGQ